MELYIQLRAQTARDYYNRGVEKVGGGNYHDAVQDFTRAIELNPNFSDAYYNRGVVEAELGKL